MATNSSSSAEDFRFLILRDGFKETAYSVGVSLGALVGLGPYGKFYLEKFLLDIRAGFQTKSTSSDYPPPLCKNCKFRSADLECLSGFLTEPGGDCTGFGAENLKPGGERLIYSYNESGGFYVEDNFGCIHFEPKPVTNPIPIPQEGQILNGINIGKFDSETIEFDLPAGVSLEIDQKVCLDNGTTRITGSVKSLGDSKVTVEVDGVFFDGHRIGGI